VKLADSKGFSVFPVIVCIVCGKLDDLSRISSLDILDIVIATELLVDLVMRSFVSGWGNYC
jgi:hypothetical protein